MATKNVESSEAQAEDCCSLPPPSPTDPPPNLLEEPPSRGGSAVFKSGSLFISSKGIGWTSWKKRWFILTRTSLVFFRSDPSVVPQKGSEVNLTLGGIDLNNSGSVVVKADKKLLTVLFPDGRDGRAFTLKAETSEDLYEWQTALENALAQAPEASHVMGQNGILNDNQDDAVNGSSEKTSEQEPVRPTVLGTPILVALEDKDGAPTFLEKSLRFVEEHGVKVEGILRQAADVEDVERRITEYEQGKLEFSSEEDAHVIADCVKYVIRELPSSPVPASCCNALVEACRKDRGVRVNAMRIAICETFPEPNRCLLQRILIMMQKVASNKAVNRMSSSAVAACMAPLLLRPLLAGDCEIEHDFKVGDDGSAQLLQAAAAANHAQTIVMTLLEEYEEIFGEGSLSPELYSDTEYSGSESEDAYDDDDEYYDDGTPESEGYTDDDLDNASHQSCSESANSEDSDLDDDKSSGSSSSGSKSPKLDHDLEATEKPSANLRQTSSSQQKDGQKIENTKTESSKTSSSQQKDGQKIENTKTDSSKTSSSQQKDGQKIENTKTESSKTSSSQQKDEQKIENTKTESSKTSSSQQKDGQNIENTKTESSNISGTQLSDDKPTETDLKFTGPPPVSSIQKSSTITKRPERRNWGRTEARKNLSMESINYPIEEDEVEIERLEATKYDLQSRLEEEVKGNQVLQACLEGHKKALYERRLALEKDVERLHEELKNETNKRTELKTKIHQSKGNSAVPVMVDGKDLSMEAADITSSEHKHENLNEEHNQGHRQNMSSLKDKQKNIEAASSSQVSNMSNKGVDLNRSKSENEKQKQSAQKSSAEQGTSKSKPTNVKRSKSKGEGTSSATSALTKLTTKLNFRKDRRNQVTNDIPNSDKTRGTGHGGSSQDKAKGSEPTSSAQHQDKDKGSDICLLAQHQEKGSKVEGETHPNSQKNKKSESKSQQEPERGRRPEG